MALAWDPSKVDYNIEIPFRFIKRIQRDLADFVANPPDGMFALPNEDNIRLVTVLVTGPKDTPYEGAIFRFLAGFPSDYPVQPPKVKCLTSSESGFQLHPHIYKHGQLCLSMLGTWDGPRWCAAMSLSGVMVSIQSLIADRPHHGVRGYDLKNKESMKEYERYIQHEVIRVAVINVMENKREYHECIAKKIDEIFNENYDYYVKACKENMHFDGLNVPDSFGQDCDYPDKMLTLTYKELLEKLESLKASS